MSAKILKPCFNGCQDKIEKLEKQNKALTKLCSILLDILEIDDLDEETEDGDCFIKFPDQSKYFRCECGCNIFRHLKKDKTKYKCNSCEELYQSE